QGGGLLAQTGVGHAPEAQHLRASLAEQPARRRHTHSLSRPVPPRDAGKLASLPPDDQPDIVSEAGQLVHVLAALLLDLDAADLRVDDLEVAPERRVDGQLLL